MMEDSHNIPVGIRTLLRHTGTLLELCYDCRIAAGSAPNDLERINTQLVELRNSLEKLLMAATASDSPPLVWAKPDELMGRCRSDLNRLETTVKQISGVKRLKKMADSSPEPGIEETLISIETNTAYLNNVLDEQRRTVAEIESESAPSSRHMKFIDSRYSTTVNVGRDQIVNYHLSSSSHRDELNLRQDLRNWLSAPDPSSNQNDAARMRGTGTGIWFIDGAHFKNWKVDAKSFLWLHGIPGCGKSVLCSTIVEEVKHYCHTGRGLALAYFYFSFHDLRKQHSSSLIRSIISQLLDHCTNVPEALADQHRWCQDEQQQPTQEELLYCLEGVVRALEHAYIVIDALDECIDQENLLALIHQIRVTSDLDNLHVLATSRKERVIEDSLTQLEVAQISLANEMVDLDIQTYLQARLCNDKNFKKWTPSERAEIEVALVGDAHGMFRWVACQLEALVKCSSLYALRKALRSLPKTLDETYDRILVNIGEEDLCLALTVLRWLAFSYRVMTLGQMAEILAIDSSDEVARYDPDKRLRDPRDILNICSSLITISGNESGCIQLAHFSVKEFLMSTRCKDGAASHYHLSEDASHVAISRDCLAYTLHFDKDESLTLSSCASESLLLGAYAAKFWIYAAQKDKAAVDDLQPEIISLLQPRSARFLNWVQLHDVDSEQFLAEAPSSSLPVADGMVGWREDVRHVYVNADIFEASRAFPLAPLYYASLIGLTGVARHLISHSHREGINGIGGRFGTALVAASAAGHLPIVQLLLDNGADVNSGGGTSKGTALIVASYEGHEGVARHLIENGANVDLRTKDGISALSAALSNKHKGIALLLLENEADANSVADFEDHPLYVAADKGYDDIVKCLLDKGAGVNLYSGCRWRGPALLSASKQGHANIVRLLLLRGANVNSYSMKRGTALSAACRNGHIDVVRLLLDNGANSNSPLDRPPVLVVASRGGYDGIVQILLERGADVNIEGLYGTTALIVASSQGHQGIVRLLLQHKADVNPANPEDDTPLTAASRMGHQDIVQLLLDNGADVNARTKHSALLVASKNGHRDVAHLLLVNGADIDSVNTCGPESLALIKKHEGVLQFLLDNGVDTRRFAAAQQSASIVDVVEETPSQVEEDGY